MLHLDIGARNLIASHGHLGTACCSLATTWAEPWGFPAMYRSQPWGCRFCHFARTSKWYYFNLVESLFQQHVTIFFS